MMTHTIDLNARVFHAVCLVKMVERTSTIILTVNAFVHQHMEEMNVKVSTYGLLPVAMVMLPACIYCWHDCTDTCRVPVSEWNLW